MVFSYALDQRHEPEYNPAMRSCVLETTGPIGVGSRFASVMNTKGRGLRMVSEVIGLDPPHLLTTRTTANGAEVTGTLRFTPEAAGGSTRMAWDWQIRTTGLMLLATPLIWLFGSRMERGIWTGLKHHLESADDAPG